MSGATADGTEGISPCSADKGHEVMIHAEQRYDDFGLMKMAEAGQPFALRTRTRYEIALKGQAPD